MTPVFGHGRLRLYLLKLLDESPRHGYEIIQQLKERFAGLYSPSAGTVYPRLARLESEGLVRHETDGGRKIYHITDAGRAELAAKAGELAELETEIRNSVRDLAEGIREEVRESARTVQEELATAAREAQRGSGKPGGGRDSAPFPFGPGGPLGGLLGPGGPLGANGPFGPDGPLGPDGPFGAGASGGSAPTSPPPESVHWSKEEWREWKQQQREQWRDLRRDWQRNQQEQRGQMRDAQRAWKEQWVRQWKEQWQDQARQWSNTPPPWAWWTGSGAGPGDTGSPADQDRPERGREERAGDEWARHRGEWEQFGPQLRELFGYLRREGGTLFDAARRHGPLGETEMGQAQSIIDEALTAFRDLFGAGAAGGGEPADRAPKDQPPTEIVAVDEEPADEEPTDREPKDD